MFDGDDESGGVVIDYDADYWRRRELRQRNMARRARCKRARRAHSDLASIYALRHGSGTAGAAASRSPWQMVQDYVRSLWPR